MATVASAGQVTTWEPPLDAPKGGIIRLDGEWALELDAGDAGIREQWFARKLADRISLPGTLDEAGKGERNEARETRMLSRVYRHAGPAWYQREIEIPDEWRARRVWFSVERTKAIQVWLDDHLVGRGDTLSAAQQFDLGANLQPGRHRLTVRVNNADRPPVGDPHQLSEHTQTNWSGMLGRIELRVRDAVWIDQIRTSPRLADHSVRVVITLGRDPGMTSNFSGMVELSAKLWNCPDEASASTQEAKVSFGPQDETVEARIPLGPDARTWDEFSPALYRLHAKLTAVARDRRAADLREVDFGLCEFGRKGTQFTINGRTVFLRGKHDACVFPLTGHAPMDVEEWLRVFRIAKSYGINHYRFHSWCPPEAAYVAASIVGIYMQPELPNWNAIAGVPEAMQGDVELRGEAADGSKQFDYLMAEGSRILHAYAHYPSFVMFALGNELGGTRDAMAALIHGYRQVAPHLLYAQGSNNFLWAPTLAEHDDFWTTTLTGGHYRSGMFFPDTDKRRVRGSFPVHSIGHINNRAPATDYDYREAIHDVPVPVIGHEIGQYQVFPDFREIKKYTGVLRARNFEVFRERLERAGMLDEAEAFVRASGALAVTCYREEIETALRTPGFGGFQLLDLQDFPGQGTALVGILNAFMESKGLITPEEWRRFCSATVPLLRTNTRVWRQSEIFKGTAELAHYGPTPLNGARINWSVTDAHGKMMTSGELRHADVPQGSLTQLGSIGFDLKSLPVPAVYTLTLGIDGTETRNSYHFWVYPDEADVSTPAGVYSTRKLNAQALNLLAKGGRVLLLPSESALVRHIPGAFQPDFWCYPMFKHYDPPGTLGILCDPRHPAFAAFPTDFHADWQWWPIMRNGRAMILDDTSPGFRPLVQVIDNFDRNHKLAIAFEAKVGKGRLLACSGDLLEQPHRPEARQLLHSFLRYVESDAFDPKQTIDVETLEKIFVVP